MSSKIKLTKHEIKDLIKMIMYEEMQKTRKRMDELVIKYKEKLRKFIDCKQRPSKSEVTKMLSSRNIITDWNTRINFNNCIEHCSRREKIPAPVIHCSFDINMKIDKKANKELNDIRKEYHDLYEAYYKAPKDDIIITGIATKIKMSKEDIKTYEEVIEAINKYLK